MSSHQPEIAEDLISFYKASIDSDLHLDMGFPVTYPEFKDFKFIVHSWDEVIDDDDGIEISENTWWNVSEISTGQLIPNKGARSDTKEEAVYKAGIALRDVGVEKLTEIINGKPKVPLYKRS